MGGSLTFFGFLSFYLSRPDNVHANSLFIVVALFFGGIFLLLAIIEKVKEEILKKIEEKIPTIQKPAEKERI